MSNMVVNTNVLALNSHRSLKGVGGMQAKASARLSSGLKINSAADDAAGLAISEKMRSQIRGLDMASKNSQDAISLIQTAEGGMQEIDNMLQRVRELVVQASNDTNENNTEGTGDRQKMQEEIGQLVAEIDSMAGRVEFNKKKVIDGSFADTAAMLSSASQKTLSADAAQMGAQATVSALNATIGTDLDAASDDTLKGILNGANSDLTGNAGAYGLAVTAYAEETAAYDTAKSTYESALKTFKDYASSKGIGLPSGALDLAVADAAWDTDTANAAALKDYILAAKDWGAEDLGISVATAGTNMTETLAAADLYDATATPSKGAIGAYRTDAKADMSEAQTTQDGFVSAVKSAQSNLDKANKSLSAATTNLATKTNNKTAAKNIENAAKEADNNKIGKKLYFQVGANANQGLEMGIGSVKSDFLGIGDGKGNTTIDVVKDTGTAITGTLDVLDNALSYVTTERSKLGAAQNRLEYTIKSLDISSENLSAAESRIRDTDMAKEMMNLTKANVLQQAATSMLAQANQAPQNVLQLLQ